MTESEVHLCDNYTHLFYAVADLLGRRPDRPTIVYIDDAMPVGTETGERLSSLVGADLLRVSDDGQIDSFARLPRFAPAILRRNLSWADRRPIGPTSWEASVLADRRFATGFVYHPGFFLSKVLVGRCDRIVMRDSGYANYVKHKVPARRMLPRLLAGRSPRYQIWGEERWVDHIEVARPDQLPGRVQHKASRLSLPDLRCRITDEHARALARSFFDDATVPDIDDPSALLLTQPLEQIGICTYEEKRELYEGIASALRRSGFHVVVKAHPRELAPALEQYEQLPRAFPAEAWSWLGRPPFDLAVSLNSTSLAADDPSFARSRLQLIPPTAFYARHWTEWPTMIERALSELGPARLGDLPHS